MWGHPNSFRPFHLGLLRNRGFCSSVGFLVSWWKPWGSSSISWVGSVLEFSRATRHTASGSAAASQSGFDPVSLPSPLASLLGLSGDLMPGQWGWGLVSAQLSVFCLFACFWLLSCSWYSLCVASLRPA